MIESNQGSSLLDTQPQPKLGHLEAPKRERLRTGKAAFELHGRQVVNREAQSRRLGAGREVIGDLSPGVRVWDRGRGASLQIQEQGSGARK